MPSAKRATCDLSPLSLRPCRAEDAAAILRCHTAVFADAPLGIPARTLAHWNWKFLTNPTGRLMQMLAVHATEGVVGLYGSIPAHVTVGGRRCIAAQGVDTCVQAKWLKHGGEHGLFPRLGRAFHERWLGSSSEHLLFIYGLPVASWRSGSMHLGWQIVRDFDVTFRELPPGGAARATPSELLVQPVLRFGPETAELFARIEPSLGVATVRDHDYLNWRYADHPERSYVLFECRERASNRLRGVCVYGTGDLVRPHTSYVVDWLQAADDQATMTAMLAALEQRARLDNTGLLCSVWNHQDPRFLAMQEHGYRVRGTPWFLVATSTVYDTLFFRERWYFTLGDSDLV